MKKLGQSGNLYTNLPNQFRTLVFVRKKLTKTEKPSKLKDIGGKEMDTKKILNRTGGVALISAGCALKLASWGLSASEVVLNGAKNMADSFVKAPDLGLGKSLLGGIHKGLNNLSVFLLKKGKGLVK